MNVKVPYNIWNASVQSQEYKTNETHFKRHVSKFHRKWNRKYKNKLSAINKVIIQTQNCKYKFEE